MYIDARVLPQKDTVPELDSPQDPSWFFDKALKPDQRTTEKEVPGETTLKEQDSAQGPSSFFDQMVKRVRGIAAKESPGEEAQALLAKAKAEELASREAQEKLEAEVKATQVAQEKRKAEEQAAREIEEKLKAEEQAIKMDQEKSKAEKPATKEAQQREAQELVEHAKDLGREEAIEVYDEAISRFQEAKENGSRRAGGRSNGQERGIGNGTP